jgi:putative ABC transport system substrate-binding protein
VATRRQFISALGGALAAPFAAHAQRRTPTLGILLVGNREPFMTHFFAGMRDLGYIEGQNVQIQFRSAEGKLDRLPALAGELVALKVDVLIASETPAALAAKRATTDIPIVMARAGDPAGTGLIASLARPGGNITGLSAATAELAGKSLELIREIVPSAKRVAALADPNNAFTKPFLEQIHLYAGQTGTTIQVFMVRSPPEFETAFAEMKAGNIDAVIVQPTLPRGPAIAAARKHRILSVSGNRAFADGGGLMSYAASLADRYRNAAPYVDRILKGAKPADLPVQQPTRFELVINQQAAREIGIVIPPALLARADDVIE